MLNQRSSLITRCISLYVGIAVVCLAPPWVLFSYAGVTLSYRPFFFWKSVASPRMPLLWLSAMRHLEPFFWMPASRYHNNFLNRRHISQYTNITCHPSGCRSIGPVSWWFSSPCAGYSSLLILSCRHGAVPKLEICPWYFSMFPWGWAWLTFGARVQSLMTQKRYHRRMLLTYSAGRRQSRFSYLS